MSFQHKELASGRWAQMSFCEQMANIGSEVSRALELLDLTVNSIKRYSGLKECLRVRECLVDYFYGDNIFSSSEVLWRKYFDAFAYAARKYH